MKIALKFTLWEHFAFSQCCLLALQGCRQQIPGPSQAGGSAPACRMHSSLSPAQTRAHAVDIPQSPVHQATWSVPRTDM